MKSILALLILTLLLSVSRTADAQTTPTPTVTVGYGVHVNGSLSDAVPGRSYTFVGLRGDVIAIDLTVTSGTLDPMITLTDSKGAVVALSDDAALQGRGSRDLHLDSLHIAHSDTYSLMVARFGYMLGTTSGGYTLAVDRIGVSSASGSALRYGDSVYNTITDGTPQVYYSFRAVRGDVISVRMQRASGDLDPALELVNSDSLLIAQNDDSPGTLDAAINGYIIRQAGVYVIIASRFGEAAGRSKGSFVLTLNSATGSGMGTSIALAVPILPGVPVQGTITGQNDQQFYEFDGQKNDVVTIHMNEADSKLDPVVALLDPSRQEITSDDDSGGGQNSLINGYILPADGTYTIVAERFSGTQGDPDTTGAYELQLDVSGSALANVPSIVPRIEYGGTVQGTITESAPQAVYVFIGQAGDTVSIDLKRTDGNLDTRLVVLDAKQQPITEDDDSGGGQNALIGAFSVPSTGVYYIVATRYGGTQGDAHTTGSFTLTLTQQTS